MTLAAFLGFALLVLVCRAFSSGMTWEVQTGGDDTNNGGGFRGGAVVAAEVSAPTVAGSGTGGTVPANTYYVVVTYQDAQGESGASPQATVTTTGTTSSIAITTLTNPGNTCAWNVYVGTTSGGPYFSQSTGRAFGSGTYTITSTPATTGTGPPGTDYSQQTGPQVTYTDLVIDGTTNTLISSAGNPFTQAQRGNVIAVTSGTGWTVQRLEVLNVDASGKATVDKSAGTLGSTGGHGGLGGCLATLGLASSVTGIAATLIFRKYNASPEVMSASANVSGGRVNNANQRATFVSYDTNRNYWNTDANRQVIQPGANSVATVTHSGGGGGKIRNFVFANPGAFTGWTALTLSAQSDQASRCRFVGAASTALTLGGAGALAEQCEFSGITGGTACQITGAGAGVLFSGFEGCVGQITAFSNMAYVIGCTFANCGAGGIVNSSNIVVVGCSIHYAGSGANSAFTLSTGGVSTSYLADIAIWGNGSCTNELLNINPALNDRSFQHTLETIALGNGPNGLYDDALAAGAVRNIQTLTTIPYTNAPSLDLSPNATAGGGALLRNNGFPQSIPGLSTASSPAIGAVQPASTAGGACLSRVFTGM